MFPKLANQKIHPALIYDSRRLRTSVLKPKERVSVRHNSSPMEHSCERRQEIREKRPAITWHQLLHLCHSDRIQFGTEILSAEFPDAVPLSTHASVQAAGADFARTITLAAGTATLTFFPLFLRGKFRNGGAIFTRV